MQAVGTGRPGEAEGEGRQAAARRPQAYDGGPGGTGHRNKPDPTDTPHHDPYNGTGGKPQRSEGAPAQPPPLGTTAGFSSAPVRDALDRTQYAARRDARYNLRDGLARFSTLPRLRTCGRERVASDVAVKCRDGVGHFAGVKTCGLVWSCPRCAAKIRETRAVEIETAVTSHLSGGGGAAFVTVTVPHDQGQALDQVWTTTRTAWAKTWAGRAAVEIKDVCGIIGTIRVTEVTTGPAGWHPHIHALILTASPLDQDQEGRLFLFLLTRWCRFVALQGWRSPSYAHGLDYERVALVGGSTGLGRYLNKVREVDEPRAWNVGRELARSDAKRARIEGNLTPFQLGAFAVETGESWAIARWREWEQGSAGRRAVFWSPGLRARLDLGDEASDEEIAAEDVGGEVVVIMAGATFDWLARRGLSATVLALVESVDPVHASSALRDFLDGYGAPPGVVFGVRPPPPS